VLASKTHPSLIKGAGTSAETPPPATSRAKLLRSQELPAPYTTAPSVLHHLSSIHWTSLLSISPREEKEEAVQAREGGTQGINTVSEDGANRCGCCAVVIRAIPVPSWIRGWFAPIAETPLAIPNAFLVRVAILHSFLIDSSLFAGPTGGSESRLLLDRTGETVVTTCDRFELFCVFAFFLFPQKAFCWGFNFVLLRPVVFSCFGRERLSFWAPNAF